MGKERLMAFTDEVLAIMMTTLALPVTLANVDLSRVLERGNHHEKQWF